MPEGPEVRKYADALEATLGGQVIESIEARTREAKAWLSNNEPLLVGRRVLKVASHGKHLLGLIDGDFYFHSHLMMWGRWQVFTWKKPIRKRTGRVASNQPPNHTVEGMLPVEKDRRERARIVVDGGAAILFSAPIFNVGEGDPYTQIENLKTLGPDVLPATGKFDWREFQRRLLFPEHTLVSIGAALLNQQILAGLGNYLRAEVLFKCRLNPWRTVAELSDKDLRCLSRTAPELARRSYLSSATATDEDRVRMAGNKTLVYQPGREYGTRHMVFRRTNLPCLRCGEPIRQLRQPTWNSVQNLSEEIGEGERTRIVYFCAKCQGVNL